jgi:hypothetical protein
MYPHRLCCCLFNGTPEEGRSRGHRAESHLERWYAVPSFRTQCSEALVGPDPTPGIGRARSGSLFLGLTSSILNLDQLGRPVGHMASPPSVGHPGLPELGAVDGTPMKYIHNRLRSHNPRWCCCWTLALGYIAYPCGQREYLEVDICNSTLCFTDTACL